MTTTRHCLALDLRSGDSLQAAYRDWHRPGRTPDAVIQSIRAAGIVAMEIFQVGDRLFMVMETDETFDAERKAEADRHNPDVQAWETLMDQYQSRLPQAGEGRKWALADCIFDLRQHP